MVMKSDIGRNRMAVAKQATKTRGAAQAKQAAPDLDRVRVNKAIQQQRNVSKMTPAQARLQLTQQKKEIQNRKAGLKTFQKQQQGKQMLPQQKEALEQTKQELKSMRAAQAKGTLASGVSPTPGALRRINAAKGTLVKKPAKKK